MENQIKNRKIEFSNLKDEFLGTPSPRKVHQIILGSLLGDMYCNKEKLNTRIEETHSVIQKDYLAWKYSQLKDDLNLRLYTIDSTIYRDKAKYRQTAKYKAKATLYRKEYRKRPEVKEKIRLYNKSRCKGGKN